MDGVGPSGNGFQKKGANDSMIFDLNMADDGFSRTGHELEAMNVVEQSAPSGEMMDVERQLGLQTDVNQEMNGALQNNEDAGSPPLTSQSPRHSTDNNHSDCGSNSTVGSNIHRASDLLMAVSVCGEINKMKITEMAVAAMEELTKLAHDGEPLWQLQEDGKTEILNDFEYLREFGHVGATLTDLMKLVEVGDLPSLDSNCESSHESQYKPILPKELGPEEPLHTEASRATCHVRINPVSLVELLMDLKQWSLVFSNIVSRTMVLGDLSSTGVEGNYDGTLQVMTAEFLVPTPLVPARESYFARYCKQLASKTWGVVDVSVEHLFPSPLVNFRRRPSGCVIQEIPNGWSKVIWVEHVEVDNRSVHNIFKPLIISGYAYGAKRWVATLVRQCERFATLMARTTPTHSGVLIPQAGRTSMLKLSERMMRSFVVGISASSANLWMPLPITGAEDMRVMTKYSTDEPGKPPGPTVLFAASFWLPASPKHIFNFLRSEHSRNKWDILSYGRTIKEFAYVINGGEPENRVSILKVDGAPILYLQESYTDPTCSYVVYAPLDPYAMSLVLNGTNSEYVAILPSGFAILPDRPTMEGDESGGSLLTIGFHIIDAASTEDYIPPESVETMHTIIMETVLAIKAAF